MSDAQTTESSGISRPVVALATAAVVLIALTVLFASWQRGFSEGARQATDQILAERDLTDEVVRLQAQLEEQRRAEDRSSATVLTAFAAGVTVLVVVNIFALVFAQQSYQRDKDALEIVLGQRAKELDQEQFTNWATALSQKDEELLAYTDQGIAPVQNRQAHLDTRMDQLAEMAARGSRVAKAAFATMQQDSGDRSRSAGSRRSACPIWDRTYQGGRS